MHVPILVKAYEGLYSMANLNPWELVVNKSVFLHLVKRSFFISSFTDLIALDMEGLLDL